MDGDVERLRQILQRHLAAAAETAAALSAAERGTKDLPHYSQIEAAAHQVGQQLSCQIQTRAARELMAEAADTAPCPTCGQVARLEAVEREVLSIDGPLRLTEARGFCDRCRRSFFPAAGGLGTVAPPAHAQPDRAGDLRGDRNPLL